MLSELRSPRGPGCLSDLVFDAWSAGELEPDRVRAAAEHLAGCEQCSARGQELDRQRAQFLEGAPEFVAPGTRAPRRARGPRWPAWVGGSVALAAVLALAVGKLGEQPELSEGDGTRSKGPAHLTFFVKRGTRVLDGVPGQSVAPGDQLRFAVTSAVPTHVAVLSLDAAGTASIYHPTDSPRATAVDAAQRFALASAVELDGVLGKEVVFGVFCEASFEVEPLRKALSSEHTLAPPAGCELDRLELVKERLP